MGSQAEGLRTLHDPKPTTLRTPRLPSLLGPVLYRCPLQWGLAPKPPTATSLRAHLSFPLPPPSCHFLGRTFLGAKACPRAPCASAITPLHHAACPDQEPCGAERSAVQPVAKVRLPQGYPDTPTRSAHPTHCRNITLREGWNPDGLLKARPTHFCPAHTHTHTSCHLAFLRKFCATASSIRMPNYSHSLEQTSSLVLLSQVPVLKNV